MSDETPRRPRDRWARLKHGIVSRLLIQPPERGELALRLRELASQTWPHPVGGYPVRFGISTIERWYHIAREAADPVEALKRKVRKDAGHTRAMSPQLKRAVRDQYRDYPRWTRHLHWKNLKKRVQKEPRLGEVPSYATLRRFMNSAGLERIRRTRDDRRAGSESARLRREQREMRGYEATHLHALWHADFHDGSLKVLLPSGEWATPKLFACLDDHSRVVCHAQWYLTDSAEVFVHGLGQALLKRGLPRELMTDNGGAMVAAETVQGLGRLGVLHDKTLRYSPHQNGKIEAWWYVVEEQLLAMLEKRKDLTLDYLNLATQAFVELDYHQEVHSELDGATPVDRLRQSPSVGRESPSGRDLTAAFTQEVTRRPRKGDGTVGVQGRRFEVPSQYRHLRKLTVRFARWNLSRLLLTDPRSGEVLTELYPQDKAKNASGIRRRVGKVASAEGDPPERGPSTGGARSDVAPHLEDLIDQYSAKGLPPAYITSGEGSNEGGGEA